MANRWTMQDIYLDFLRNLLKDKVYIHLVYMTGILPIKKYGTHSALNMFDEFSMISPGPLAYYVGFTEEVRILCEKYGMDMEEVKSWHDGYHFEKNIAKVWRNIREIFYLWESIMVSRRKNMNV